MPDEQWCLKQTVHILLVLKVLTITYIYFTYSLLKLLKVLLGMEGGKKHARRVQAMKSNQLAAVNASS